MKHRINKTWLYGAFALIPVLIILVVVLQSIIATRQRDNLVREIHNVARSNSSSPDQVRKTLLSYEDDARNLSDPILNLNLKPTGARASSDDEYDESWTTCDNLFELYMYTYEGQESAFYPDLIWLRNIVTNILIASDCAL